MRLKFWLDAADKYVTIGSHVKKSRSDRIWKALSDPSRRRMLDLLAKRPRTTGQLVLRFPQLSRFAVMKHLKVLHGAGLIVVHREGRKRWNTLNAVPLREVFRRWVGKYEDVWADSVLNLRDAAESQDNQKTSST